MRSLWLVQSCNVAADAERQKLHDFLEQYQYNQIHRQPNKQEIFQFYRTLREKIERLNREALAELESLDTQMRSHQTMLRRGVESLEKAAQTISLPDQRTKCEELKKQLDDHYRENPLTSQVEALQERVLKGLQNVIIKHVPGRPSGVKIILKLLRSQTKHEGASSIRSIAKDSTQKAKRSLPGARATKSAGVVTRTQTFEPREQPTDVKRSRGRPPKLPLPAQPSRGQKRPVQSQEEKRKPKLKETPVEAPITETTNKDVGSPELYCFCHQPSFGDMIACDFAKCRNGEWFHYKCVGLLNRAEVSKLKAKKWFCSETCKNGAEKQKPKKKKRRSHW